jgi:hypothetical protein
MDGRGNMNVLLGGISGKGMMAGEILARLDNSSFAAGFLDLNESEC